VTSVKAGFHHLSAYHCDCVLLITGFSLMASSFTRFFVSLVLQHLKIERILRLKDLDLHDKNILSCNLIQRWQFSLF